MAKMLTIADFVRSEGDYTSCVGKRISPPRAESYLYNKASYGITNVKMDKQGRVCIHIDTPILKKDNNGYYEEVCKTLFRVSDDPDSIWCKFTMAETTKMQGLSPVEVAALNNTRSRGGDNTCVSCGKQLTPLFGQLYGCLDCEK